MTFTSFLYFFRETISFLLPLLNTILLFYIALMIKKIYDVINEK